MFFDGPFARRLWNSASLVQTVDASRTSRGESWFHELIRTNDAKTAEIILMMCDSLWTQRNQRIFTDQKLDAEYMPVSVAMNLRSFHHANAWPERFSEALAEISLLRSIPLKPGIRFDAGILNGKAAVGIIVLDGDGGFIKAVANPFPGVTDPIYAEGEALATAISVAQNLGLEEVQLVGDCLTLIKMVCGEEALSPGCADLIHDIRRDLLANRLENPCWIPRYQNNASHALARYAKSNAKGRLSWDIAPEFILSNDAGRFQ